MTAYTAPAPHEIPLPTRTPARTKVIPHVKNRIGSLTAFLGLGLALLSLYLPWLSTGGGEQVTALDITEIIDVRSVAPVLFLGLVVLSFLVSVAMLSRLGVFAAAAAVIALGVLAAHLALVWTLVASTGAAEPTISGLPTDAAVTYGPYVAVFGFILVAAGSAWAARSAEYVLPDLKSGRPHRDQ